MFTVKDQIISDKNGIGVGHEIILEGELRRGMPVQKIQELQKLEEKIAELSKTDIIALNVSSVSIWDSLGIFNLLDDVVKKINPDLLKRKKHPISIIGDINSDNFLAVRDKYPESGTEVLPWYRDVKGFLSKVELA